MLRERVEEIIEDVEEMLDRLPPVEKGYVLWRLKKFIESCDKGLKEVLLSIIDEEFETEEFKVVRVRRSRKAFDWSARKRDPELDRLMSQYEKEVQDEYIRFFEKKRDEDE